MTVTNYVGKALDEVVNTGFSFAFGATAGALYSANPVLTGAVFAGVYATDTVVSKALHALAPKRISEHAAHQISAALALVIAGVAAVAAVSFGIFSLIGAGAFVALNAVVIRIQLNNAYRNMGHADYQLSRAFARI